MLMYSGIVFNHYRILKNSEQITSGYFVILLWCNAKSSLVAGLFSRYVDERKAFFQVKAPTLSGTMRALSRNTCTQ
jgi:hypothetical protein